MSFPSQNWHSHNKKEIQQISELHGLLEGKCPGKEKGRAVSRDHKCEEKGKRGGFVFTILNKVLRGGLIGQVIF